jgi:hypothetical protein
MMVPVCGRTGDVVEPLVRPQVGCRCGHVQGIWYLYTISADLRWRSLKICYGIYVWEPHFWPEILTSVGGSAFVYADPDLSRNLNANLDAGSKFNEDLSVSGSSVLLKQVYSTFIKFQEKNGSSHCK